MLSNESIRYFVVCSAGKVAGTGLGVSHPVVWHQDHVLRAVYLPVKDLFLRIVKGSLCLLDAVRLTVITDPGNDTVVKIIRNVLTLDLPGHRGGQQPGVARVTAVLIKRVTAGVWPGVVILTREKTQPPAQVIRSGVRCCWWKHHW